MNVFFILAVITAVLVPVATVLSFALPPFRKNHLPAKMVCSALFLITAVFAAFAYGSVTSYTALMIGALFFGLLGDFFLDWKNGKTFPVGVICFTVCHLIYIGTLGFNRTPRITGYVKEFLFGFLGLCVVSVIHVAMNKIKFEGKNKALIPYCLTLMVSFTVALTRGIISLSAGDTYYGICLIAAGALFVASDGCLAAKMFGKPLLKNLDPLVGITYFPAQALFAMSIFYQ